VRAGLLRRAAVRRLAAAPVRDAFRVTRCDSFSQTNNALTRASPPAGRRAPLQ
jgi:hypothetical protein